MPNRSSKAKRLTDLNKLAKSIVDQATGQTEAEPEKPAEETKNPAAVASGRLGGMKGGKARAAKFTKAQRSEIVKKAAAARWAKK